MKLAEKYFSRKIRQNFCKVYQEYAKLYLKSLLFSGDDAVQPEVERHRQLLHESRLSQGDLSIQFYPDL